MGVANSAITGTNPYYWALTDPRRGIILNKYYNTGDFFLILTNNSQSSSWSIAWMGGGGGWRFTVRMRPTSYWTAPPWKVEQSTTVDCSTTWDESEFQSPTVRTAKECRNACVEEPTARNLNRCFALVLSSAATRPTLSGWIPAWPITTLYSRANLKSLRRLYKFCQPSSCNICVTLEVVR